jgi:hypothetical protein
MLIILIFNFRYLLLLHFSDVQVDDSNSFFLKRQNIALGREIIKAKNQLSEVRKELDRVQKEKSSMESLVAVIDRSWNQVMFLRILLRLYFLIFARFSSILTCHLFCPPSVIH